MVKVDTFRLAWRLGFCGIRSEELAERAGVPQAEVDGIREQGECSEATFERIAAVLEMALQEERWLLRCTVAQGDRLLRALQSEDVLPEVIGLRVEPESEVDDQESVDVLKAVDGIFGEARDAYGVLSPSER